MKKILLLTLLFGFASTTNAAVWVDSYFIGNGTYVEGHWRSDPDGIEENNNSNGLFFHFLAKAYHTTECQYVFTDWRQAEVAEVEALRARGGTWTTLAPIIRDVKKRFNDKAEICLNKIGVEKKDLLMKTVNRVDSKPVEKVEEAKSEVSTEIVKSRNAAIISAIMQLKSSGKELTAANLLPILLPLLRS